MSIASQDVYLNLTTPISVIGSGGGGSYPVNANFSTLNVSSMITSLSLNVSSINGAVPGGGGGGSTTISTLDLFVSTVKPAAGLDRIDFIGDPAASLLRLNFSTVNMNTLLGNTSQFNSVQSPPTNNLAFNSDGNVNVSSLNLVARTTQTVVLSTLSLVMNSPQIILKSPQPVSVSSINVSSINDEYPVWSLLQYQALSTLAA